MYIYVTGMDGVGGIGLSWPGLDPTQLSGVGLESPCRWQTGRTIGRPNYVVWPCSQQVQTRVIVRWRCTVISLTWLIIRRRAPEASCVYCRTHRSKTYSMLLLQETMSDATLIMPLLCNFSVFIFLLSVVWRHLCYIWFLGVTSYWVHW